MCGQVADLLAGDAGRDDVGGCAEARHVFGQLPDGGDPPHLGVDVLAGPACGPCHRHLAGQHVLPGIVLRAHHVEGAEVSLGGLIGQADRVFEFEQAADGGGQAADEPGHDIAAGSMPVKSRQQARMRSSSVAR